MPLPPALAARLAKRGIITPAVPNAEQATEHPSANVNEEIIAEDYDPRPEVAHNKEQYWEGIEGVIVDPVKGHNGCPNKSNIYHECTKYCVKTWRKGKVVPDEMYLDNKKKVLELWPLPSGWEEAYDEGTGQHYYWNVSNNLVSWLPPLHPKAKFSESASHLREERLLKEGDESEEESEGSDQEVPQQPRQEKHKVQDRKDSHDRRDRGRDRKRMKRNDLDPMDPASYSEVPRGSWSAGLSAHAMSGVDSTVTGQVFQMRPYPAPGAILAANAKHKQDSPEPDSP